MIFKLLVIYFSDGIAYFTLSLFRIVSPITLIRYITSYNTKNRCIGILCDAFISNIKVVQKVFNCVIVQKLYSHFLNLNRKRGRILCLCSNKPSRTFEQHLYFEYHSDLRSIELAFQNKSDILGLPF